MNEGRPTYTLRQHMTHNTTVRNMPANENGRGNLAGFEISCPCGFKMGTTLACDVANIQREHVEVMTRVDAERAAKANENYQWNAEVAHEPHCDGKHRFIGSCPAQMEDGEKLPVCPICEKKIGDEWDKCLCLHEIEADDDWFGKDYEVQGKEW